MASPPAVWVVLYSWDEAGASWSDAERRGNRQFIRWSFESKGLKFRWEHSQYVGHKMIEAKLKTETDCEKALKALRESVDARYITKRDIVKMMKVRQRREMY